MKTLGALVMTLLSLHALAARSSAQATLSPRPVGAPATEAPAQTTHAAADDEQARGLFAEAKQLYADGDYQSALEKLRSSYELAPLPGLLFDVAQTLRRLGRCAEARTTLTEYLTKERHPALLSRAEQMRHELASCEERARGGASTGGDARATAKSSAGPVLTEPSHLAWRRPSVLVTLGLGLGLATAALGLALRGRALADEVSAARHWDAELAHKDRQGVRSNRAAWACGSLALALVGSSLTLRLLGREAHAALAGGATLAWGRRF